MPSDSSVFHIRVAAEADAGVLARVLERFQQVNVIPCVVRAERATTGLVQIEVRVGGLSEHTIALIVAKLGQVPSILKAYWHR